MGVISFYDVAKAVVDSQDFENRMLKAYIRDWPVEAERTSRRRAQTLSRHARIWPLRAGACDNAGPSHRLGRLHLHVRQHPRRTLPRHQLRREPRPGDRLRDRRLPARHGAVARPTSSPSSTGAAPAPRRHVTQRNEPDAVEILSGVYEGRTTGTPICLLIRNTDQRSKDYGNIAQTLPPRPRRLHLLAQVRPARPARRRPRVGAADRADGGGRRGRAQVAARAARHRASSAT